jgi:hypothetical protein
VQLVTQSTRFPGTQMERPYITLHGYVGAIIRSSSAAGWSSGWGRLCVSWQESRSVRQVLSCRKSRTGLGATARPHMQRCGGHQALVGSAALAARSIVARRASRDTSPCCWLAYQLPCRLSRRAVRAACPACPACRLVSVSTWTRTLNSFTLGCVRGAGPRDVRTGEADGRRFTPPASAAGRVRSTRPTGADAPPP